MNSGSPSRWQQAQIAYKAGERQRAWGLAHEAARENPADHRVWLLLAALAPDAAQSLAYVERAETLRPNDPTVQKARAWAEKRPPVREKSAQVGVAPPSAAAPAGRQTWGKTAVLFLSLALMMSALVVGGLFLWQTWPGRQIETGVATAVATPLAANQQIPLASPTATATPTSTDHHLAKQIAPRLGSATPRPIWTITPTPTITPSPTPTLAPTFVGETNQWSTLRPVGVGPEERWIDVDLSAQTLYAYEGDQMVFTTLISSGLPNFATVTGMFRIYLRYQSQTMNGYLLGYDYYLENVPYVMYFYRDFALHGTYWHSNFGQPMSHGCVNLETSDAAWLYEWTTYGTVVNVHY